ncbi:hypothetical protein EBZ39_04335 [bacterium]|nr:hypothetical protein [bacterium]
MKRPDTFVQIDEVIGADSIAPLSCADAFSRREHPLVLFTGALLFTHGGFDRDPVIEFDARFPAESKDLRPFFVDLARDKERFFFGFGVMPAPNRPQAVNWDKRLYCIDHRRKEECFEFLGGIAYSNQHTHVFASSFMQTVLIPDPTSRTGQTLEVHVAGVMSNKFVVYVEPQFNGPAVARRVSTAHSHLIPPSIYKAGLMAGFNGKDPLDMRD